MGEGPSPHDVYNAAKDLMNHFEQTAFADTGEMRYHLQNRFYRTQILSPQHDSAGSSSPTVAGDKYCYHFCRKPQGCNSVVHSVLGDAAATLIGMTKMAIFGLFDRGGCCLIRYRILCDL